MSSKQLKDKQTESLSSVASESENQKTNEKKEKRKAAYFIIFSVIFGLLFLISVSLCALSYWYKNNYFLEFKDLLYIITGPIEGTGNSTIMDIVRAVLPFAIAAIAVSVGCAFLLYKKTKIRRILRSVVCILCVFSLVFSLFYTVKSFRIDTYTKLLGETSTIYEDYYVDPNSVTISANGKTKNLIYIYLESLENSHFSKEYGGFQDINYLPNLTTLALENVNFSGYTEGKIGGFVPITGTHWTIAALLGTSAGIPFAFSNSDGSDMDKRDLFAPGLTTLGDILEDKGYKNVFMCGSNAAFGGRAKYFTQHGNYELFDLYYARENNLIDYHHNGWWGFDDADLYRLAKIRLTELANDGQPFNFTMLTVDTHSIDGYVCDLCESEHDTVTGNVLKCADRQVMDFVEWIKAQDFYEDCTIVITGDHYRHDNSLVPIDKYGVRRIYNCFINSAVSPVGKTFERTFTTFDIFPTTLAAMGFEIEGERLGLGTNLFAGKDAKQTLAEELSLDYLSLELSKKSDYYRLVFEQAINKQ